MVLVETIRSSAACCAVIGFTETIGFLQAKRSRHTGRQRYRGGLSHPIADSVNQLSVASFIRMVNDVVKLPVGYFLEVVRYLDFTMALFFVVRDAEYQAIITARVLTAIRG